MDVCSCVYPESVFGMSVSVKVQEVPATQQVIKYIFRICFTVIEYVCGETTSYTTAYTVLCYLVEGVNRYLRYVVGDDILQLEPMTLKTVRVAD